MRVFRVFTPGNIIERKKLFIIIFCFRVLFNSKFIIVEMTGFEPATPAMQMRCSTN